MAPETSGTVTNDGNARCSPIISPITPAFLLVLIWWFTKDDSRPGLGEVGLGASPKFDISQVEWVGHWPSCRLLPFARLRLMRTMVLAAKAGHSHRKSDHDAASRCFSRPRR